MKHISPAVLLTAALMIPLAGQAQESPPATPSLAVKKSRSVRFLGNAGPAKPEAKPQALRLTVDDAVAQALANNRALQAAALLIREAEARRMGAGLMDNPELELGAAPGLHAKGTAYFQAEFRQKFPLSSRLRLAREVADIELAAAKEEVLIARRKLIGDVKRDAVRLLALRAESTLVRQRAELAAELATAARARVARGEGSETDAGFLDLEAAAFTDELARLDSERVMVLAEWRVELGFKPDADIEMNTTDSVSTGTASEVKCDCPECNTGVTSAARKDSKAESPDGIPVSRDNFGLPDPAACPECRKLTLLAAATQKQVELEIAKRAGDITVGIFGQLQHDQGWNNGHENQTFVGLKVTVPLPFWNDNASGIAEAKARRDRQQGELAAEVQRLDGEAMAARREFEKLAARLPELAEKLAPAAAAQTARVRAALEKGEGDRADLYRALDKQTEIERRTLTLRRDIALALVKLETALSAHPALKDPVELPALSD